MMVFLKLGGSFITQKDQPETARVDLIQQAASEIAQATQQCPTLQLLVGHGSGSFGHVMAEKYGTHHGASTKADWRGFIQVWASANRLHRIVMGELLAAELPVISFPPSATTISTAGEIQDITLEPIQRSLAAGLIPVIHGDVAFDTKQGACILSTETVMAALIPHLKPTRLLLAGLEEGVLGKQDEIHGVLPQISLQDLSELTFERVAQSDVTGGMGSKVTLALTLKQRFPEMEILIFSGVTPGNLSRALSGEAPGTTVTV
jgi:isopentenyl phosphate kinase